MIPTDTPPPPSPDDVLDEVAVQVEKPVNEVHVQVTPFLNAACTAE
jgi:hypothetical protein